MSWIAEKRHSSTSTKTRQAHKAGKDGYGRYFERNADKCSMKDDSVGKGKE